MTRESDPYLTILRAFAEASIRFVVIGVYGANYYASATDALFTTDDLDLFLPLDPENTLSAWQGCRQLGYELESGREPLGEPLDAWLAERVVQQRATVGAHGPYGVRVDLTYTMGDFAFDEVWRERRTFRVEEVTVPVASLRRIVESKRRAGRAKDLLFLTSHAESLKGLLARSEE